MNRTCFSKEVDPATIKGALLAWAQLHREFLWLDSNNYNQKYGSFDAVLAVDAFTSIKTDTTNAFQNLEEYRANTADWIFGFLAYDLKNDVEELSSNNPEHITFPDLYFFQPKKIFFLKGSILTLSFLPLCEDEIAADFEAISAIKSFEDSSFETDFSIFQRTTHQEYIQKVKKMQEYIQLGAIYEANLCMEFYGTANHLNPLQVFKRLNNISQAPFAAMFKLKDHYILCASPERFLRKEATKVISQPIKGTVRRGRNEEEDHLLAIALQQNEKERAENIMIVDLVRNDLSHHAQKGSVQVEELCAPYQFKQVHHLISTVTAHISEVSPTQIIRNAFPMGSMTGAPKISAMKIIEELEDSKRGVYSGTLGYFSPVGDFDFNVMIRSIFYDAATGNISFSAGSAITAQADPEAEYRECLLKAKAMRQVLGGFNKLTAEL